MKKNGLLQTIFLRFFENSSDELGTGNTKISTFCPNIADDRFISGLILKIEGLKMHCLKIDVCLFPRMKYNSVIYCDTRYA
jgi:hypothetical protein